MLIFKLNIKSFIEIPDRYILVRHVSYVTYQQTDILVRNVPLSQIL